jgi:hypothetical protein
MEAIGHAGSFLLACGFFVFLWMIFKPLNKVRKKARKATKRLKKYERTPRTKLPISSHEGDATPN